MADNTTRAVMDQYVEALIHGADFGRFFAPEVGLDDDGAARRSVAATRYVTSSWPSTRRPSMRSLSWSTC